MNTLNFQQESNLNLALNKPTAQSSVYQPEKYGYNPYGACNGQKTGAFGFCTLKEDRPWWQIDLQGNYEISEIKIYNRIDSCQERALTLNVLLSQDALNWELYYSNPQENIFGGIDGKPLIVNGQNRLARYIRLQLRDNEYFHLDEVEIYGIPFSAKGSNLKSNQDETTLSANFYGDLLDDLELEKRFVVQTGLSFLSMKSLVGNPKSKSSKKNKLKVLKLLRFVDFDQLNKERLISDITAISIERAGRFGNSIRQLSHAYHIAKSIGVDRIYLPQFWYIKEGELTTPSGIKIVNVNKPNFLREKIVLEGMFFDYKTLAPLSKTTPEHYLNMIDLIEAGAFNLKHSEPLGEQDLVIHIRSGDIFKNNVHLGYGQPPFSFYAKIIELQSWHSISLVFEDKSNPIIDPLIDFCRRRCSQVQEISSDLKSDIEYLLRARKLVVSNGTFCPAIALISKSLNTVYSFENEFSIKYNPNISQIVRVVDRQGVYQSEILSSNWQNTELQRKLMLEYPTNVLDFDSDNDHQIKPTKKTNIGNMNINQNTNTNLALNKPTAQSSVYRPEKHGYDPHGACNGKKTRAFGFCTTKEDRPWWQIDLQRTCHISEVKIYNRIDSCQERASTLNVLLSQDALNWELCYSNPQENIFGSIDGKPLIVNVQHQVARFVRLQLRENDYFHLNQVEIYGIPVETDGSEPDHNQDEATLSANFYSGSEVSLLRFSLDPSNNFVNYRGQLRQDKWCVMMTKGKQKGVFLEIGSTDGVGLNNTFCLEKNFSWSGICVEPNPDFFKRLCVNRTAITLPYAFYKQSGQIVEFVPHATLGTISDFLSTDSHASARENFISQKGTIKVITACPEDILNLYKFPENFDFLSLDVEGAELDVLESFNLSKYRPALACIEHNHVADKRLAIFKLLSSHGYQRIQCRFDDWYYNLDILQALNPEIPLSHYQQVLEYFCTYHNCKFVDKVSLDTDKLAKKKVNDAVIINEINPDLASPPASSNSAFSDTSKEGINLNSNPNITKINLALNKPTAQSSIYQPDKYGYDPQGGCNGKKTRAFSFCTMKENQPWWQIDLQGTYHISEIEIYNRMDCCQERASTLNVLLSQDALNWELCYSNPQENIFGGTNGKSLIVDGQNRLARYVRLQLRENEYLHLDEVEIYGLPLKANGSDFKCSQDEEALSSNFYAQAASLPFYPSPEQIKQIALKSSQGIIHVGAHKGQEAEFYAAHNKSVIWIEALPKVFQFLEKKIAKYSSQKAINALVTDTDGKEYKFNISNNSVSSSLFEFGDAKGKLYPRLTMVNSVYLIGKTLGTIYREFNIDASEFDFLLLDVQGAELMVLKGAESVLHNFKYILTEVSTVDIYKEGVLWDELKAFLNNKGFKEVLSGIPRRHCDVLFVNETKESDNFYQQYS